MVQASNVSFLFAAVVVCSAIVVNYARAAAADPAGSVVLVSGKTLYSQNHKYSMSLEGCNLKVYKHGQHIIWRSGMENVNVECQLSLLSDGNAVIFNGINRLWASNTGTSMDAALIVVRQDKGILFRRTHNGRVLVTTWTTYMDEDSQETDIVSIEFDLPTQSALYQAPVLSSDVHLLPRLIESPVHSSTRSRIWLKNSPARSSTPARDSQTGSRHFRFFIQSPVLSNPQVDASPVDSTPYQHQSPIQNSPVLSTSSFTNFKSPSTKSPVNPFTLSGKRNVPLDTTPSHAGNTSQHEVLLNVLMESPAQSAPQSELSNALSSPSQLNESPSNGSPVSGDSKSVPVSSTPFLLIETPVQSTPAADVSSSPMHDIPAGELKNAPVKSAPQADRSNSPVQSTPVRSTPRSHNSPVHFTPAVELRNSPVDSTSAGEVKRSPAKFTTAVELESSPVGSTPVRSSPQPNNAPLDVTPAVKLRRYAVESTPVRSAPHLKGSRVESTPVHSTAQSNGQGFFNK